MSERAIDKHLSSDRHVTPRGFWVAGAVVLGAGILAAALCAPLVAEADSSLDDRLAAIDARVEAYASEFSAVYGATDVNYTGSKVTMTVGDKSYECEAPKREKLAEHPTLRCLPLVSVLPAAVPAK